jgi:hypothetical protein
VRAVTPRRPATARAFRRLTLLVVAYVVLSVLTVGVVALLRNHPAQVNSTVWTRDSIVAGVSLITLSMTLLAARGSRGAWWRLRIVSAAQIVAIVVIIAVPGAVPLWVKLEQGVCGVILLGIAGIANGRVMRDVFSRRGEGGVR